MGISGGGLDIGMTEKFLDYPNIGTGCAGQGGKGMAAAVRGKAADRRILFPKLTEKSFIVPGEIPGMEQGTILCAEQVFSGMGEMLQAVGEFRQKRDSAEAVFCLGLMLRYLGVIVYQVNSPVNGQGGIRDVGGFQAQQFPTAYTSEKQSHHGNGNALSWVRHGKVQDEADFFQRVSLPGLFLELGI